MTLSHENNEKSAGHAPARVRELLYNSLLKKNPATFNTFRAKYAKSDEYYAFKNYDQIFYEKCQGGPEKVPRRAQDYCTVL